MSNEHCDVVERTQNDSGGLSSLPHCLSVASLWRVENCEHFVAPPFFLCFAMEFFLITSAPNTFSKPFVVLTLFPCLYVHTHLV